jgi:hypothetical protein
MDTTRQVAIRDALARHLEADVARMVVDRMARDLEAAYSEVDAATRRRVRMVALRLGAWYRDGGSSFPHALDSVTEACQSIGPVLAARGIREIARARRVPACLFQADLLPWRGAWMECLEVSCRVWYGSTDADEAEMDADPAVDRFVAEWINEHDADDTDTDGSTSSYESADLEDV